MLKLETRYLVQESRTAYGLLAAFGFFGSPFGIWAASMQWTAPGHALIVGVLVFVMMASIGLLSLLEQKTGAVTVDRSGVMFGRKKVERARIRSAQFTPQVNARPATLTLIGHDHHQIGWFGVEDRAHADRVLDAMGVTEDADAAIFDACASNRSASDRALSAAILLTVVMAVAALALHLGGIAVGLAFLPVLFGAFYFTPAKVHLGADGLLYRMRRDARFIAWSEVRTIEEDPQGVVVITGRERVVIAMTTRNRLSPLQKVERATLLERANETLRAFRARIAPNIAHRVARQGRTTEAWALALGPQEGTFREAPLRAEDLWGVVESPVADVSARAGAAAVLAREATEEDRVRLRVAAETCAEPRLRVVLDRAATGGDVLEALDDVEDAERGKTAVK